MNWRTSSATSCRSSTRSARRSAGELISDKNLILFNVQMSHFSRDESKCQVSVISFLLSVISCPDDGLSRYRITMTDYRLLTTDDCFLQFFTLPDQKTLD